MTRHRLATALAAALMCTAATAAFAQPAPAPATAAPQSLGVLTAGQRDAAVDGVIAALRKSYVEPDKVPAIVGALEKSRAAGRYATDNPGQLAERLTEDLGTASGDGHLYVVHDPARFAAASGAPAEAGQAGPSPALDALIRADALRHNHGLSDLRILPGNIRYLRITAFEWVNDETGQAYDDAMRFLRGGDAVIIDLRGNGGGDPAAVRYLTSHFMDGDKLLVTFLEAGKPPQHSYTLQHLPAGRLKGKLLYVLIDGRAASAAEEFAYSVRQFGLGELVGEKTAGGANNNLLVPLPPAFMFSVSYGKPAHAVGGGNWEGVGVAPTLPSDRNAALEVAQLAALGKLAAAPGAAPGRLAEYAWAATGAEAGLNPPRIPAARLKTWAGSYGRATVAMRDGDLWLTTSPGGPLRRLVPLTGDGLFAITGSDRVRARFVAGRLEMTALGDPNPRVFVKG